MSADPIKAMQEYLKTRYGGTDETLDISVLEVSKERVVCQMPITKRVTQPFGILHGGTTVALAESVASIASQVNVDPMKKVCLGLEINANHISPGFVGDTLIATGYPISIGKTNQVWGIEVKSLLTGKLICISRCTTAVVDREPLQKRVEGMREAMAQLVAKKQAKAEGVSSEQQIRSKL